MAFVQRSDSGPQPEMFLMKMRLYPARAFLAVLLIAFVASYRLASGQILIGTGDDVSYAVVEAGPFGPPLVYEYHYTYDPAEPPNGFDLFTAIDFADPNLSLGFVNFGDELSPNYFLDSITYGSTTLTSTAFPTVGPFWVQWVSGAEAGFPNALPIASGVWTFGSGLSSPYRAIGPGSWDGFIFNVGDAPPSISPVPEPKSAILLIAGITVTLWMIRRRRHEESRV